ncbi:MAG: M23 family metallopeptidase [Crocinitomicaceae bacterium]|nr:M23 family metallopeptidase [Crocinitomicaceae bacterium]
MSKQKYRYNPESLSYETVNVSLGKKILRVLFWMAPSIVFGLILAFFFTKRINSPKEKQLQSELKANAKELKRIQEDIALANKVLDVIESRDEDLYRAALYAEKFPDELRQMGTGGSEKYAYLSRMTNGELIKSTSQQIDKLEKRLNAQSISFRELLELAKGKEKLLACVPAIQPVRNTDLKKRISGFGFRIDPIYKTRRMHTGMDFTAPRGTDVYATGDGVVELVERKRWGYGKSIVINHGFGYKTRYAHLSAFKVKQGQKVKRGELIGLIGSTGKSTGPHLHYEVIKNGKKVNPIGYYHSDLTPEQYETLLEMSENSYQSMD